MLIRLYRARLLSYYRGSPGDTDMVYMIPVFFNIETGEEIRKDEFRNVNAADLDWSKEPGICYIKNTVRGYQQVDLYRFNANTKSQELLYTETSTTNIDNFNTWIVEEWGKIIITSERDGWKQLYALNLKDKTVKRLTEGNFFVNDLVINKQAKTIFFIASGKETGHNPYYWHAYRIGADGKGFTLLTPENANHDISVSPDGKYIVDNMSAPEQPTVTLLREAKTGKMLKELSKANIDAFTGNGISFC